MQLEGHVSQFPLRELIEMVVYSSVKGLLELRNGDEHGRLYFSDGVPCYAQAGAYSGLEAVGYMFEMEDASFRFYANSIPESQNLWMDPLELIESGEHLARSWGPLRSHITSMDMVPALVTRTAADSVQIQDAFWPVLSAVDGQRTIATITRSLQYTPLDVCTALVALKRQGLITIRGAAEIPPLLRAPQPAATTPSQGYFEQLIARTLEEEAQKPNSRYAPPDTRYQPSSDRDTDPDERYRSAEDRYVDAEG